MRHTRPEIGTSYRVCIYKGVVVDAKYIGMLDGSSGGFLWRFIAMEDSIATTRGREFRMPYSALGLPVGPPIRGD